MTLHDFIIRYRQELIERARAKVARRSTPRATTHELEYGIPLFLTQLVATLHLESARATSDGSAIRWSAAQHGGELLREGLSIAQVVHDYGDLCQAVTELALELGLPVGTQDFHTLNRCLDDAIASAVTEYARQRDVATPGTEVRRKGFLVHEVRNHLQTAMLAYQAVKSGKVGVTGSTIEVLGRSLLGLRDVIDRSLAEVRLTGAPHVQERIRVADLIEEAALEGSIEATSRGLHFSVEPVDSKLFIEVDRLLFASAISNLLHNAFKFTRPSGHVSLRTNRHADHVSIDIEDECGGLTQGCPEALFRPFEQRNADRTGLGLGLAICRQAVEADRGRVSARDLPGKGCVFTIEMPLSAESLSVA